MIGRLFVSAAMLTTALTAAPASAQTSNTRASQSRNMQLNAMSEIPVCQRRLGTIAIVEPDNQWWRELNLGSPEAILKIFISRSGCFGLVNLGGAIGGLFGGSAGSVIGGLAGGISVKKGEANVTLSVVNARTTEEEALVEGYARKKDVSWGAGGGAGWWGGFAAAGASGYQNTEIGQVIVLAYLDAYIRLVTQLGGLPANAAVAAPQAR